MILTTTQINYTTDLTPLFNGPIDAPNLHFLEGSQSQGCYIEYNSLITDYYSGNVTIVRTSVDTSIASKCGMVISDIYFTYLI